jgi:tetratricopeptide (TPR) repeat protein
MKCPKCGFESSGESCVNCGVIFAKLGRGTRRPRPAPPTKLPLSKQRSTSIVHVLVLASILFVAGLVVWQFVGYRGLDSQQTDPPGESLNAPMPSGIASSSGSTEDSTSSRRGEQLVLPGLQLNPGADAPQLPQLPQSAPGPELPQVTQNNVTPELVDQIVEMAQQYPDDIRIREGAAHAFLALAYKRASEGRHREALEAAREAEGWDASPRDVARLSATSSLALRDLNGALKWAQAALAFGPDPDMYVVLGQVFYLREEMDRAVEAWTAALALRDDPRIRALLEKAAREKRVADDFERQRLSHFIVKYEGETMESTGRMVLGSLEKSYSYLKSTLGFEPAEPIVVTLYTRQEYTQLGGPHWSAGRFDGKVKVPVRGLRSLDQRVESTLRHELTHAFIYARTGNNIPRWLNEGIAEHCEGTRAEEFGTMLAEKIDMDGDLSACVIGQRCDVYLFYPAAASLVDYMLQNRGMGGIRSLLDYLGEGMDINQALQNATGRDEMGLVKDWQYFMKRRYLR